VAGAEAGAAFGAATSARLVTARFAASGCGVAFAGAWAKEKPLLSAVVQRAAEALTIVPLKARYMKTGEGHAPDVGRAEAHAVFTATFDALTRSLARD
jgi:hypothetical protein